MGENGKRTTITVSERTKARFKDFKFEMRCESEDLALTLLLDAFPDYTVPKTINGRRADA